MNANITIVLCSNEEYSDECAKCSLLIIKITVCKKHFSSVCNFEFVCYFDIRCCFDNKVERANKKQIDEIFDIETMEDFMQSLLFRYLIIEDRGREYLTRLLNSMYPAEKIYEIEANATSPGAKAYALSGNRLRLHHPIIQGQYVYKISFTLEFVREGKQYSQDYALTCEI